jgi:anhydro-N-acetylmuramic acid kinase
MSGSSLDGLDVAHCRLATAWEGGFFVVKSWELLQAGTLPFSGEWQQRLRQMPGASAQEYCSAHAEFGRYLGELTCRFLEDNNLRPADIGLIASHGHTIFHEPGRGFTAQLGDGAALAAATGCPVVSDFRTADVALGGQGAPLAPMADRMLFPGHDFYLNLGGIANLTCHAPGRFVAFDVCGANQALNALAQLVGLPFDDGGQLAASGRLDPALWAQVNAPAFFAQPYPKSLSNQWVQQHLTLPCLAAAASPVADRLHTVCQHVASQLERSVLQVVDNERFAKEKYSLLATGGGAFNSYLMQCIRQRLPQVEVVVPSPNTVKFKEALLMALLGVMRLEGAPNCMASVTGARRDAVGGAMHAQPGRHAGHDGQH